jgi:hypothetical protein
MDFGRRSDCRRVPGGSLSRLAWPGRIVIGATLGPLALVLIFVVLFAIQNRRSAFSLAHTESLWPFSIVVSTISFLVYAALLRKALPKTQAPAKHGSGRKKGFRKLLPIEPAFVSLRAAFAWLAVR